MKVFRCSECDAFNRIPDRAHSGKPVCGRCKKPLDTSGVPQAVDGAGLARAIDASPVPVVVDFWAPWCGPCRMASPILDEAARAHAGDMLVLKVNTDENPAAGRAHRVSSIPAFVVFQDGRERDRQVGLLPAEAFKSWIERQAA